MGERSSRGRVTQDGAEVTSALVVRPPGSQKGFGGLKEYWPLHRGRSETHPERGDAEDEQQGDGKVFANRNAG